MLDDLETWAEVSFDEIVLACDLDILTDEDNAELMIMVGRSRLGQQLLDDHFRLLVFAFAVVVMADAPLRVGEGDCNFNGVTPDK